jgi:hypothetical protein
MALVTVFMAQQIREKAYFEADLIKFLPTDLPAVKSDDYSKKNFNTQDTVLIGIEKQAGTVLDLDVLRSMEAIVLELKDLKASKTFDSRLKGQVVTLEQPVGIDPDAISSLANLEDAVLDKTTGSVVSGSVIEKLKKDFGIAFKPGEGERLPERDEDLAAILPGLKERIMRDRMFRGNILSEDLHAATIRASVLRKQTLMRRYAILELSTAIDPARLTARFQGKDSTFPFTIHGQKIGSVTIDDSYIGQHSAEVRKDLKRFLANRFKPALADEPELKALLGNDLSAASFQAIMQFLERNNFFMHPDLGTWQSFMNDLYEFMLTEIDPFSRENLEFQLHNVEDIVDMVEVYYLTTDLLQKHQAQGVKSYVAGSPVVIGVFSQMMSKDMTMLIPIAIGVVVVILILSFRSVMGVLFPLVTVLLSVIWTLGIMAISKVPFTISTSGLPIIILAVGTAYGIHLLNRYYEDAQTLTDKNAIVQKSVKSVGVAIVMAAITTIAGFTSNTTTSLTTIRQFGIFSAVGVIVALFLTLTLTPAMLVVWKLPKKRVRSTHSTESGSGITPLMFRLSRLVIRHPVAVLAFFGVIVLASLVLMKNLHFEGSMMSNFKKDNVIFQSDRFLNKNLTGTTDINLIFTFRDQINLENPQTIRSLREKIDGFVQAAGSLPLAKSEPATELLSQIGKMLQSTGAGLPQTQQTLLSQLQLVRDIFNEEFRAAVTDSGSTVANTTTPAVASDDLEALADSGTDDLEGLSDLADSAPEIPQSGAAFAFLAADQLAGVKDIHRRLGLPEETWDSTASGVITLRSLQSEPVSVPMVKSFNRLNDFLVVDIKQPLVLHKLEKLYETMTGMESPQVIIEGKTYKPSGLIVTPVDFVRKFYKVFYHDDNPAFDRLPDVERDGFTDGTLTDRSIIGVVLNQALSADRDGFEAMITPDLKEFQVKVMIRGSSSKTLNAYVDQTMQEIGTLFPKDDPYIETIRTGGGSFTSMQISNLIGSSQIKSIALSFLFVFVVTFFIFRSLGGGLYSLIPLLFTVILNFGLLAIMGGEITMATMMVASIAIGTGVDYTIHFLERLKIQLREGDDLQQAYTMTVTTSGKAILVNATAVAAGFLVFLFSAFNSQIMLGILVAATMLFSSVGALILLPVIILKLKPDFLLKARLKAL